MTSLNFPRLIALILLATSVTAVASLPGIFGVVRGLKMAAAVCFHAAEVGRATEPRLIVFVAYIADVWAGLGPFG